MSSMCDANVVVVSQPTPIPILLDGPLHASLWRPCLQVDAKLRCESLLYCASTVAPACKHASMYMRVTLMYSWRALMLVLQA